MTTNNGYRGTKVVYGGYTYWVEFRPNGETPMIGCEKRWPMTDSRFLGDNELADTLTTLAVVALATD